MRRTGLAVPFLPLVGLPLIGLLSCTGDDPLPVTTVVVYADAQADGPTSPSDAGAIPRSDANVDPLDAGDASKYRPLPSQKVVFVTWQTWSASSLKDGPLAVCSMELQNRDPNRKVAVGWVQGSKGETPSGYFLPNYDGPWVLPDGTVAFAHRADIFGGSAGAAASISQTLFPDRPVPSGDAWSALDPSGNAVAGKNCDHWEDNTAGATTPGIALGKAGPTWAFTTDVPCHLPHHLICFEQ